MDRNDHPRPDARPALDRDAVHAELDGAREVFHQLLTSADAAGLRQPTNGTRWTNEQLLFHMLFGYMVVHSLLVLVRIFARLPDAASRVFAALLDRAVRPFNVVNYWGSVVGVRVFPAARMAAKFDRVTTSLRDKLSRESQQSLSRGMHYPTTWDPFFSPYMTLADVYAYPTKHFHFHREQLTI